MVGQMEVPASNVAHGTGLTAPTANGSADNGNESEDEPLFHQVYELCEVIGKGPFSLVRCVFMSSTLWGSLKEVYSASSFLISERERERYREREIGGKVERFSRCFTE